MALVAATDLPQQRPPVPRATPSPDTVLVNVAGTKYAVGKLDW